MTTENIDISKRVRRGNPIDEEEDIETISIGSSVEIRDAAINESWDWASVQRRLRDRRNGTGYVVAANNNDEEQVRRALKSTRLDIGAAAEHHGSWTRHQQQQSAAVRATDESWLGSLWRWWNERAINSRLQQYDDEERRQFVGQRLARVASLYRDECTKTELCQLMVCTRVQELLQQQNPRAESLRRKYGQKMSEWIALYAQQVDRHCGGKNKKGSGRKKRKALDKAVKNMKCVALERAIKADVQDQLVGNALDDPLMSWFRQRHDVTGRMLARIQNLAACIVQQIAWSFLIETGRPRTDLSRFYAEFDVLETFFDKVPLTAEESAQKAFDANCLFKVRNRKLVCVDWSRVRLLTLPMELTQEGVDHRQLLRQQKLQQRHAPLEGVIIGTEFDMRTGNEIGSHGDFINASRVMGGPLLNTFILTQAPLLHTVADFWRMVWQERSEWIFMLCEASIDPGEDSGLQTGAGGTLLDQLLRTHCPYYWPRFEGDELRFGCLHVRNAGIDMAADPLFTVTHLDIWLELEEQQMQEEENDFPGPSSQQPSTASSGLFGGANGKRHRLQLWQWDWRSYTDFHWPFRVLLRARHSKRPTILMCADGCGRAGTLALIEIFLMQLLRGAVSVEHPMLTAAVFLRLQRRHAVANPMQWLFAYRTVLHWLQPFLISWYHRLVLGFTFPDHGFCAQYTKIAKTFAHRKNLNI